MRWLGKQFLTAQIFDDCIIAIDGIIWYIIKATKKPSQPITPWNSTSEPVEHLWASLKIGRHHGGRTNLDMIDVTHRMRNLNRFLSLDTVAHTRGETLIPYPSPEVLYTGNSVTLSDLKVSLTKGLELGREKFVSVSCFVNAPSYGTDSYFIDEEDSEDDNDDMNNNDDEVLIDLSSDKEEKINK